MSTRSIVAFKLPEGGVKGVYVHYDGDPSTMLPELDAIIKRDGALVMAKTILEYPVWASIEAGDPADPRSKTENPLYTQGYGRRFGEPGINALLAKMGFEPVLPEGRS